MSLPPGFKADPTYPDRTCPKCHEDINMEGGCQCNGYTNTLTREMQCDICYRVAFRNAPGEAGFPGRGIAYDPLGGIRRAWECPLSEGGASSGRLPQSLFGSGPITNSRVPPAAIS